jgi:hypothetical protein
LSAGAGGAIPAYDLLETQILGSNQSSITFSSLGTYSSTYKHLQIRYTARSSISGTQDGATGIRLNGDTGSNYSSHGLTGNASSVTSYNFTSQTFMFAQLMNGNTATAGAFGAGVIDLLDCYSTTKNKTLRWLTGFTGADAAIRLGSGAYLNTSSLTSVTIDCRGNNYLTGSRFSIYGLKG